MGQGLYIGRKVDPDEASPGERIELDPDDLLTHGLIVGMTGSGKTGLAVVILEELLRQGVPVIAIDPKGDLANLLLLFDRQDAASFEPWIDAGAARREGKDVKTAAAETAAAWKKGLAGWGLGAPEIAALRKSHEAVIFTPGSSAGVPLNVLDSLDAPAGGFAGQEEELRDEIQSIVTGLLTLVGIEADPLQSPSAVFLASLVENGWRAGRGYSLETLIGAIADPPFEKIGALPLETAFPRKDRQKLLTALNTLLASPSFEAWRSGEPLDVGRLLGTPERPRLSIVSIAHLGDAERLFVTALLLDKVKTWMRRQGGTTALRALVYMDEVFGYFPPHPANPPTKRPLLTLLKQARAQGVGVVLATQNPVDLDYKGLANMGTWLVGTLQTQQDRERLEDGLAGAGLEAGAAKKLLAATRKRVFLLHDVHRKRPELVESRWAMSYLRGPLTRDEIARLTKERPAAASAPAERKTADTGAPVLPPPYRQLYLSRHGGQIAEAHVLVKYAARYKGADEATGVRAWPLAGASALEALEAEPLSVDERAVGETAPAGVRYGELPAWLDADAARELERALKARLPDKLTLPAFHDPATDETSRPGEARAAFAERLKAAGGGDKTRALAGKLDKKRQELAMREQEVAGRRQEKWLAVGSAVLRNIGLVMGRKRSVTGVSSVLTKNRMEDTAEARVEALRAEVQALEAQYAAAVLVDPTRFEELVAAPVRGGVTLLRHELVWVY
ncbi:MAG TPA: helicase HerA-like domain-containing protein [Vicinamibacteria bacterium]